MKKAEKILFVDNLTAELKLAKSLVLVNYTGLSVASQQELKKRLKDVGSKMLVVKNTLLKRASETAKINKGVLTDEVLSGQTALVVSEGDPTAFIQVLGKFAQEFSVPQMKVGIVDGLFQDNETLMKLSTLPERSVLLSQLLQTLMFPAYGLVSTLNGNLQKLVYVLDQKSKS